MREWPTRFHERPGESVQGAGRDLAIAISPKVKETVLLRRLIPKVVLIEHTIEIGQFVGFKHLFNQQITL
jgi:hypothetical protein